MEEIIIARRIKEIRTEKNWTLEELAKRTGFTKGLLSKIENNKVSPPVSTLAKIARALDVSLGDLFGPGDITPLKIVRSQERKTYSPEGYPQGQVIETLISGFQKQKMEPLIISIEDLDGYETKFYNHPGQEFIFIMEGSMGYRYDNEVYLLSKGDSLYFDSGILHGPLPLKGQRVRYLSVLCS